MDTLRKEKKCQSASWGLSGMAPVYDGDKCTVPPWKIKLFRTVQSIEDFQIEAPGQERN